MKLAIAVLFLACAGCPKLPDEARCSLGEYRCHNDYAQTCSGYPHRWHNIGTLPCAAVGGTCVVALRAHCR